jgi:hypothetical protein
MVNGQIETADFDNADVMKIIYNFVSSDEWELIHGEASGKS